MVEANPWYFREYPEEGGTIETIATEVVRMLLTEWFDVNYDDLDDVDLGYAIGAVDKATIAVLASPVVSAWLNQKLPPILGEITGEMRQTIVELYPDATAAYQYLLAKEHKE